MSEPQVTPLHEVDETKLEDLLEENLELAKANNKILRRMYRNSIIGTVFKVVIWLLVLGVPIFFLSTYMQPILSALEGKKAASPSGVFGLPSADQLREIVHEYQQAQMEQQPK